MSTNFRKRSFPTFLALDLKLSTRQRDSGEYIQIVVNRLEEVVNLAKI